MKLHIVQVKKLMKSECIPCHCLMSTLILGMAAVHLESLHVHWISLSAPFSIRILDSDFGNCGRDTAVEWGRAMTVSIPGCFLKARHWTAQKSILWKSWSSGLSDPFLILVLGGACPKMLLENHAIFIPKWLKGHLAGFMLKKVQVPRAKTWNWFGRTPPWPESCIQWQVRLPHTSPCMQT